MAITNTLLNTSVQPIYVSSGTNAVVVTYFCNTSNTTPVLFSVHLVPSGNIAVRENLIYNNVNVTAEDTYVMDTEKLILGPGDSLHAYASEDDMVVATVCHVDV